MVRWGQDDGLHDTATGFALALDALTILAGAMLAALFGRWLIAAIAGREFLAAYVHRS